MQSEFLALLSAQYKNIGLKQGFKCHNTEAHLRFGVVLYFYHIRTQYIHVDIKLTMLYNTRWLRIYGGAFYNATQKNP